MKFIFDSNEECLEITNEGTLSTEKSLLSADSVQKVEPSEVWRILKNMSLLNPSVRSYTDFTGILASTVVYATLEAEIPVKSL